MEPFVHSLSFRSQFNQSADRKLSCRHATHVARMIWAKHSQRVRFRETTTRSYSWTPKFQIFAWFVQIIWVCGRALRVPSCSSWSIFHVFFGYVYIISRSFQLQSLEYLLFPQDIRSTLSQNKEETDWVSAPCHYLPTTSPIVCYSRVNMLKWTLSISSTKVISDAGWNCLMLRDDAEATFSIWLLITDCLEFCIEMTTPTVRSELPNYSRCLLFSYQFLRSLSCLSALTPAHFCSHSHVLMHEYLWENDKSLYSPMIFNPGVVHSCRFLGSKPCIMISHRSHWLAFS